MFSRTWTFVDSTLVWTLFVYITQSIAPRKIYSVYFNAVRCTSIEWKQFRCHVHSMCARCVGCLVYKCIFIEKLTSWFVNKFWRGMNVGIDVPSASYYYNLYTQYWIHRTKARKWKQFNNYKKLHRTAHTTPWCTHKNRNKTNEAKRVFDVV